MRTTANIARFRLFSQQLEKPRLGSVKDLVGYMGALQAQDHAMAKWAIGIRIPGITEKEVEAAINNGQILRTHVLRPTWHFISADDIYWVLELSKANIGSALRSRHKELELSDKVITKTNTLIEKLLSGGKHLSREEIVAAFEKANIHTDNNRASHILLHAELAGLIASGRSGTNKHTYTLLGDWVKKKKSYSHEEALAKLAFTYFTSHGPATLPDFTWWSGLGVKDARLALELVKEKLVSETSHEVTYWFSDALKVPAKSNAPLQLLPAFDEYLISYKDRTASLLKEHHKQAFSANGIFWPTLVEDGQVRGLWKRQVKKDSVIVEARPFQASYKISAAQLKKAAEPFGKFLGKKVEIVS